MFKWLQVPNRERMSKMLPPKPIEPEEPEFEEIKLSDVQVLNVQPNDIIVIIDSC